MLPVHPEAQIADVVAALDLQVGLVSFARAGGGTAAQRRGRPTGVVPSVDA